MPTYDYECTSCGHRFELFQSFSDEAIKSCPTCEGEVKKVYSAVGVVFKGSGFYKTDSNSKTNSTTNSTTNSASAGKNSEKSSGESSGKKSD